MADPAPTYLLVDDNATFAALLKRGFARHALDLAWAQDADAALAYNGSLNGIVLDLNLGGQHSGLQLLPSLKKRHPDTPIVILTGYASISTAVNAIKLGAVHYLAKPAEVSDILNAFAAAAPVPEAVPLEEAAPSLKRATWEHIQFVLAENQGNVSATARALHMHRRTLQRMLAKHPVKK